MTLLFRHRQQFARLDTVFVERRGRKALEPDLSRPGGLVDHRFLARQQVRHLGLQRRQDFDV